MTERAHHSLFRRFFRVAGATFAASVLLATVSAGASTPSLESANLTGFAGALVNQSSRTLYVLSVEQGAALKCKSACLSTWKPVLVKDSVTTITLGAKVDGKIGFVKSSATTKQVTFNSFPLYTYSGDSGPRQANGEGLSAYGGRWYVVKASSTKAATTEIRSRVFVGRLGHDHDDHLDDDDHDQGDDHQRPRRRRRHSAEGAGATDDGPRVREIASQGPPRWRAT
jgi:predicted lipoprotein with Yx(FWY)xxD motif